jgi:hypothetical protein
MEILKFESAGTPRKAKKNNNLRSLTGLATVAAIAVLGSTLAANISLGSAAGIEFGQGVQVTAACDDSITVTPTVSFVNAVGGGTFYLSTIALTDIDFTNDTECVGKVFTLNAYDDSSATPLQLATSTVDSSAISVATFANSTDDTFVGTTGISVVGSGDGGTSGSVTLGFGEPSSTSGAVYKITLQSSN